MFRRSLVALSFAALGFFLSVGFLNAPCEESPSKYVSLDVRTVIDEPNRDLVLLVEPEQQHLLTIVVGNREGRAIRDRLLETPPLFGKRFRPLTHDLLFDVVQSLNVKVHHVQVDALFQGTFLGSVWLEDASGGLSRIDARPSDAMALALATDAPIWVHQKVMLEAAHRIPSGS
ncbi:MAG: bifunctional nuclease family protein [Deltaproteobacteria bacterium]|nr:bifunctional nuclease family protein [Deltaproteobacteria bacterium]